MKPNEYFPDMRRTALLACFLVVLVGCGQEPPTDRASEAKGACEEAVRARPGLTEARLSGEVRVERMGSGGWTVEGPISGGRGNVRCGVFADGDADEAPLRVDGLDIG